jgi:hypothetical protein
MTKLKDKSKAHHLNRHEMAERHQLQASGQELKKIPANGPEANGYMIDAQEAHLVHVKMEIRQYDVNTGKQLSAPSVQVFTVPQFKAMKEGGHFSSYAITVLHAPEFAKATLGSAVEGTRVVDTNYAAMRERYEGLVGKPANPEWSPLKLEAAIELAEEIIRESEGQHLAPIDDSKAAPHVAPVQPLATNPDAAAVRDEVESAVVNKPEDGVDDTQEDDTDDEDEDDADGTTAPPVAPVAPATTEATTPATGRRGAPRKAN